MTTEAMTARRPLLNLRTPGDLETGVLLIWVITFACALPNSGAIPGFFPEKWDAWGLLIGDVLANAAALAVCWHFLCRKHGKTFRQGFALSGVSNKTILLSILWGVLAAAAVVFLLPMPSWHPAVEKIFSAPFGLLVFSFLGLYGPPFEEIYYRGFLFSLIGERKGPRWAFAVVTSWFALAHCFQVIGWESCVWAFLSSALLTAQRHFHGSLIPSIITHWVYNLILVLAGLLAA
jgi:membrane protease YdiL (CAAX protease family)